MIWSPEKSFQTKRRFSRLFSYFFMDHPHFQGISGTFSSVSTISGFFTFFRGFGGRWTPWINFLFWIPFLFFCFRLFYLSTSRSNSRPKLRPTFGRCSRWFIFFKILFYQKQCKHVMNIELAQIRGALW